MSRDIIDKVEFKSKENLIDKDFTEDHILGMRRNSNK